MFSPKSKPLNHNPFTTYTYIDESDTTGETFYKPYRGTSIMSTRTPQDPTGVTGVPRS